jgi:hypothetical protein
MFPQWRSRHSSPPEHTAVVIMASTASTMAVATEILAALGSSCRASFSKEAETFTDLFYDLKLNAAAAMFQTFATQMIGYGIAGLCPYFNLHGRNAYTHTSPSMQCAHSWFTRHTRFTPTTSPWLLCCSPCTSVEHSTSRKGSAEKQCAVLVRSQ